MNEELHIIDTNQSDGFGDCHGKMAAEGVSSSPHDATLSQPVLDEGDIMRREEAEQGRWYQLNYFWDVISPTLSASARQVWLAFFRHSDLMGKSCITRSRIAAMLSISKVSVSAGIKELKDAGLIDKLENENGYQLSLCSKADLTPPVKQALHPSKADLTPPVKQALHPPLRKLNTPRKADLTPPVKQALHITEYPYRTDIQNTSTQLPPTPKKKTSIPESEEFKQFYGAYPRKVNKPGALKAWQNKKLNDSIDIILAGLERWKGSRQWTKDNGQYIPHPATWLNQERWNDDPDPAKDEEQRKIDADIEGLY